MLFQSKKKKKQDSDNFMERLQNESGAEEIPEFGERSTVQELIAPNGVNTAPYNYMIVDDNGVSLYTMCFYVDKMPRRLKFGFTFAALFDFPEITTSVFINPESVSASSTKLDKHIITLDTECYEAENRGDRNRYRKMRQKMANTEKYAMDIEGGDNKIYDVQILCTVQAVSLDRLVRVISELHSRVKNAGMELASCYGVHPEAFVSGYTTNRVFKAEYGLVTSDVVKVWTFDKLALSTIFNHTHSSFSHENGVVIGRDRSTGKVVLYDLYHPSHNGYGVIVAGMTGTGKSATVKIVLGRLIDFDYYMRIIDYERKGGRGEYSLFTEMAGGVNFQIRQDSANVLNPFELDVEEVWDESTGREYITLDLAQKIVDASNLIMSLIKDGNKIDDFSDATSIQRIVTDTVTDLYALKGIKHGDVDSLYTTGTVVVDGKLSSGKRKKELPTLTDFYKIILVERKHNKEKYHDKAYPLILDAMKDRIRELYYCDEENEIRFLTRNEYEKTETRDTFLGKKHICPCCGKDLHAINGVRCYFDGQSTIDADASTRVINIDLSALPKKERGVAMLVATDFMNEQYIKKNSMNPLKAHKMILLNDEVQKSLIYEEGRVFLNDVYATARKRNVSPWSITQALKNFDKYPESQDIIKNATTIMLLKQDIMDRDFLKKATPLTDAEIDKVISQGGDPDDKDDDSRKGELCLIDNGKVVFVKVDYLVESEADVVETDIRKIQKMHEKRKEAAS